MNCKKLKRNIDDYFIPINKGRKYIATTTDMAKKEITSDLPDIVTIIRIPKVDTTDTINAVSLAKSFGLESKSFGCMQSNGYLYNIIHHNQYGGVRGGKKLMVVDLTKRYPELALGPASVAAVAESEPLVPVGPRTMSAHIPKLDGLPPELILVILEHLECNDVISLAHTNKAIRDIIITYIGHIYQIMPTMYPGIKDIIKRTDLNYRIYLQICALLKNKYAKAYTEIMKAVPHQDPPDFFYQSATSKNNRRWIKLIEHILTQPGYALSFYQIMFDEIRRTGHVSYTEFVLLITYLQRRMKAGINSHKYQNAGQVITKYRIFRGNNPSIEDGDEFMLNLLITEHASFPFAYNTISALSKSKGKTELYRRLLVLLNLFKLHDGPGMEILISIVNEYNDDLIHRLKILQDNGINIQDLHGNLRIKTLKNLNDRYFEWILELHSYDIDLKTIQQIITLHQKKGITDKSYGFLVELLNHGISIDNAISVITTITKKTQISVYSVLVKKKGLNHNDAYGFITRMNLKHDPKIIQKRINKYTLLISKGITSSQAIYLIDYLSDEQIDLVMKHKDKFDKTGVPVTDVYKYKLFVGSPPEEWENALITYIHSKINTLLKKP